VDGYGRVDRDETKYPAGTSWRILSSIGFAASGERRPEQSSPLWPPAPTDTICWWRITPTMSCLSVSVSLPIAERNYDGDPVLMADRTIFLPLEA
jgi:hypothetical protein